MSKEIRVIQYGAGPIGAAIVRLLLKKHDLRVVGALDIVRPMWAETSAWSSAPNENWA